MTTSEHRLRFAYSTINWGVQCDLPAALEDIRSTGWGAVELFAHSLDLLGTPNSLRRQLGDLEVATLFSGIEIPDNANQQTTQHRRIEFAAEVGASSYGLVGGARLRWRPPSNDEYTQLADICEELSVFSEEIGVGIGYHPHVGCTIETSEEIDKLVQRSANTRLCLDASHIALAGEDPIPVLDRYWDRMEYVHLKDWGRGKFQELGRGTIGIDFAGILSHLVDRKFNGWVVLEQSQSDLNPKESARINAEYLANLGYDISL
ncbi:sugar phosphate isomerase/epimerase [soil metagenome]